MTNAGRTGYEPLNTLKPIADGIWLIDGPAARHCGLRCSSRATVVRLENGDLWVHSPTQITAALKAELQAAGPVRHLVAPNWLHYLNIADWQAAFPEATAWAAPGVTERAAEHGMVLHFDRDLGWDAAETFWEGQLDQIIVRGSETHREAVFFHRASKTLILTDLIVAFETAKLPVWMRPLAWIAGVDDSDGKMPLGRKLRFRDKTLLADSVEQMINWGPERVILAHGRWYRLDGVGELHRAFRRLLYNRRWDRVAKEMDAHQDQG